MEKERSQRFESARDLAFALEAVTSSSTSHETFAAEPAPRRGSLRLALALLALLLLAAVASVAAYRFGATSTRVPRATFTQLTTDAGVEQSPALSPDGKMFAFVRGSAPTRRIFLQRVDGRSAIALSRSEADDDRSPAFSPDGSQIAFRSSRDGGGIFVMGATGESVRRISSEGFDPSWSPDGQEIAFASEETDLPTSRNSVSRLSIVNVATGAVRVLSRTDGMQPQISPNGRRVLYWGLKGRGGQRDLYTISMSGEAKTIVPLMDDIALDWNGVWAPDGRSVIFSSDRGGTMNLWRLAVDEETGQRKGDPRPLGVPAAWAGFISITREGTELAYVAQGRTQELRRGTFDPRTEQVVVDEKPVLAGTLLLRTNEPSPDGQWIAFTTEGRQEDVFVMKADGSEIRQLTNDAFRDRGVSWMPDGLRLVFYSARDGQYDAWSIRTDGSGLTRLTEGLKVNFPVVSADGRSMVILDLDRAGIVRLDRGLAKTAEWLPPLPHSKDAFFATGWSPDGTRIAGTEWTERRSLLVYTLATRQYASLHRGETGGFTGGLDAATAKWVDEHRLLWISAEGQLVLDDLEKKTSRALVSLPYGSIAMNGRTFVVSRRSVEMDVWRVKLEQ
jgi:Tol biopolymer transport system component